MYTIDQLRIFRSVVNTGSFNKAAEQAYMTPSAVMKKINALEEQIGVKLFIRTYRGQKLTKAGEQFYKDAGSILELCESAIENAREAENESNIIKLGSSVMTPPDVFSWLWKTMQNRYPEIQFELVPFDIIPADDGSIIGDLDSKMDFVVSTFDDATLKARGLSGIEIARVPLCVVMSVNHRLASKESIDIDDLKDERLLIIRSGMSSLADEFRDYIENERKDLGVNVEEIFAYSVDIYNRCAGSDDMLLGMGNSVNIHPLLKRIPINWDKESPVGLLYAKEPRKFVKEFVEKIKAVIEES